MIKNKEIRIGNFVTTNGKYPDIAEYFDNGPREVIQMKDAPNYTGGKFAFINYYGKFVGLYINGLKKA